MEFKLWIEHMGFGAKEAAQFLNQHLDTRYPTHRVKEWLGLYGFEQRSPPQKVEQFVRGYLSDNNSAAGELR